MLLLATSALVVLTIIQQMVVMDVMVSCNALLHIPHLKKSNNCMTDIDECTEGTAGCDQTCTNVPGSYFCSCESGYRLASNLLGCIDIDERAGDLNGCSQNCMNLIGSYNCSCNHGYRLASDGRMCNGECLLLLFQIMSY